MPDKDIVLSIGMDTQDAEKSMKSFEDASKRFSAALSQVMKLPNTNLEKVIGKLRSSANAYGKAQRELSKVRKRQLANTKETKELENEVNALKQIVQLYQVLDHLGSDSKLAGEGASLIKSLYDELKMDLPGDIFDSDVRSAAVNKILKLIDSVEEKIQHLKDEYEKLGDNATAAHGRMTMSMQEYLNTQQEVYTSITTDIWQKPISSIAKYIAKLKDLSNGNNRAEQSLMRFKAVLSGIGNDIKKLISRIQKVVKLIGRLSGISAIVRGIRNNLDSRGIDWKTGLRYIIQYGLGFRSLFFLVRKLRSAFSDAIEDMGKSIPRLQQELDRVSISVNTLKGALAVSFAPLVKVVAALMERLAAAAIRAANAIGQFFAVITGQNVWYRLTSGVNGYSEAVKGSTKATKENEKAVKKQLAAFDDIDVLVKDLGDDLEDTNPGGGGGGDFNEIGYWEEVARPMSKLAELIKEAWKADDVVAAFEEVGRYIGEYLEDALEKLLTTFWPKIREKAEKVAMAIAGTINGFFQTDAVVYLAKNIAAAINTALGTLSQYWNNVNWGDMGAKLRDSIQALIDDVEWGTLAEYLKGKFKGIIDLATNLIGDGSWIKTLGEKISGVFSYILENVPFKELGSTLNTLITGILDGITGALRDNEGTIGKKVREFLAGLDIDSILHSLGKLLYELFKLALQEAFHLLESSAILKGLLSAWILGEVGKLALTATVGKLLATKIATAMNHGITAAATEGAVTSAVSSTAAVIATGIVTTLAGLIAGVGAIQLLGNAINGLLKAVMTDEQYQKFEDATLIASQKMRGGYQKGQPEVEQEVQNGQNNIVGIIEQSAPQIEGANTNLMSNVVQITKDMYTVMGEDLSGFTGSTLTELEAFRASVGNSVGESESDIVSRLVAMYSTLGYDLSGFTGTTIAELQSFMESITSGGDEVGENVNQNTEGIKEDVQTTAEEAETSSELFKSAFEKMAQAVSDAAAAIAASPIKPVIDTSSIDAGIAKLQTFLSLAAQAGSASVNVPSMGNVVASIRSNTSSIAAMAKGGVIPPNKPFLAMLGDQKKGTNIEAPLDTITQAMQQALATFGVSGGGNQEIILNIDGATLARLTVPYNLDELNRKGYNVKVLESR